MKKIFITSGVLALISATTAMAEIPPKPESCPSAASIRAEGFQDVIRNNPEDDTDFTYVGFRLSHYGTPNEWGFALVFDDSNDLQAATAKGNELLQTVTGNPEPKWDFAAEYWACFYNVKGRYNIALAATPVDTSDDADFSAKLKHLGGRA